MPFRIRERTRHQRGKLPKRIPGQERHFAEKPSGAALAGASEKTAKQLLAEIKDAKTNYDVRDLIIKACAKKDASVFNAVSEYAVHDSPVVRAAAINGLGAIGGEKALSVISEIAMSLKRSYTDRMTAIKAAGAVGGPHAVEMLNDVAKFYSKIDPGMADTARNAIDSAKRKVGKQMRVKAAAVKAKPAPEEPAIPHSLLFNALHGEVALEQINALKELATFGAKAAPHVSNVMRAYKISHVPNVKAAALNVIAASGVVNEGIRSFLAVEETIHHDDKDKHVFEAIKNAQKKLIPKF